MRRYVLALLLAAPAFAAPVTISWTHPTQWTDGAVLIPADITNTNIYCTGSPAAPGANPVFLTVQTIVGNATSAVLNPAGGQWCAVATIAKLSDGSLRESDKGALALIDPKRPRVPVGLGASVAPPILCSPGQVCPVP